MKKWLILSVLKYVTFKNLELSKWLILVNNKSKQFQKFPISLVNHEDLQRKLHNFGRISANNFHCLNINFRNLRFSACVNFDDCQAVRANLKEAPMSCLLILANLSFDSSNLLHVTIFWGHPIHCSHCLKFKIICKTLLFKMLLFIFRTNALSNLKKSTYQFVSKKAVFDRLH